MSGVYKLRNEVMHYDWGSDSYIPELLGIRNNENKPYAELWMGTHPRAPSLAVSGEGERTLSCFSGELPFLFKLLAVEKPLSIQVHPGKAEAEAGVAKENALGIPLDGYSRSYKDQNHKPEILCALTPFSAMCGFRKTEEIKQRLSLFSCPSIKKLRLPLDSSGGEGSGALKTFLRALFDLSKEERAEISEYMKNNLENIKERHKEYVGELELIERLLKMFPGDPSALSPLYLNVIRLKAGDAVFLPTGILHAYVHGAGVELMAASDNVIRGGLTTKHIDRAELFSIVKFVPFMPEVYKPTPDAVFYRYGAPCRDFSLFRIKNSGRETDFPVFGASILVCIEGTVFFCFNGGQKLSVKSGESVFIAEGARGGFRLAGDFEAYAASPAQ
jgi:mannose-6-phosphate isomerase